ncbi:hypothetical protein CsSME_00050269 [Camellia sinensis var. sinensis]
MGWGSYQSYECPRLMCLADLEFDYINPYDSASRINKMIMPEFITQGVLCFLYLITGHWFMSLLSVPYLYYNVRVKNYMHSIVFQHLRWLGDASLGPKFQWIKRSPLRRIKQKEKFDRNQWAAQKAINMRTYFKILVQIKGDAGVPVLWFYRED